MRIHVGEDVLKYFPPDNGKYEVSAGLKPLKTEEKCRKSSIFQMDKEYPRYRENIKQARSESLEKYNPIHVGLSNDELKRINFYIIDRLLKEYPQYFSHQVQNGKQVFTNLIDEERVVFDSDGALLEQNTCASYRDLWDALASQVPEDLAVWKMNSAQQREWLAALHLTSPGHWAAREKIGKGFVEVHAPVAGIKPINDRFWQFVQMICQKGPFERFVWSLVTDDRLNHHPEAPPGQTLENWNRHRFDSKNPKLFLRVERQTLSPFPQIEASLFSIRIYVYSVETLEKTEINSLISAVESMTKASLKYKGLSEDKESILRYFKTLL